MTVLSWYLFIRIQFLHLSFILYRRVRRRASKMFCYLVDSVLVGVQLTLSLNEGYDNVCL